MSGMVRPPKPVDDFGPLFCRVAEAKAAGIQQAEQNASLRWCRAATDAVLWCAREYHDGFTADEVWTRLQDCGADPIEGERNPSALGPVMLKCARDGFIAPTGEYRLTTMIQRHRDVKVWRAVK